MAAAAQGSDAPAAESAVPLDLVLIGKLAEGSQAPRRIHIAPGSTTTIGRASDCTATLLSAKFERLISRVHVIIDYKDGVLRLRDNKSVNGILVNDTKVLSTVLSEGDRITFARVSQIALGKKARDPKAEFEYRVEVAPVRKRTHSNSNAADGETDEATSAKRARALAAEREVAELQAKLAKYEAENSKLGAESTKIKKELQAFLRLNSEVLKAGNEDDDAFLEALECSICADLFVEASTLACSHTYCKACIMDWIAKHGKGKQKAPCPICRRPIKCNPVRTLVLDAAVAKARERSERMRELANKAHTVPLVTLSSADTDPTQEISAHVAAAAAAAAPAAAAAAPAPAAPSASTKPRPPPSAKGAAATTSPRIKTKPTTIIVIDDSDDE